MKHPWQIRNIVRNRIHSSVICEEINFLASEIKSLPQRDKEVRQEPNQAPAPPPAIPEKRFSHRRHLDGGDGEQGGALILWDNYRRDTLGGRLRGGPPLLALLSENSPQLMVFEKQDHCVRHFPGIKMKIKRPQ